MANPNEQRKQAIKRLATMTVNDSDLYQKLQAVVDEIDLVERREKAIKILETIAESIQRGLVKGQKGDKGEDGYTPTTKDILPVVTQVVRENINNLKGKDGYTPQPGVDYNTPEEKAEFILDILDLIEFDEKNAEQLARELENLPEQKKLTYKAIKDAPDFSKMEFDASQVKGIEKLLPKRPPIFGGGSGATFLASMRDVDLSALTKNSEGKYVLGGGGGSVSDEAYGVSWDGVTDVAPSKNAVYDAIAALPGGHDAVTVTDSSEIDFTLTGQNITASLIAGSIDETKLDASVNASLDLADSASQPGHTHATSDITSGTFDDARIAESNVTQHEGALSITESQISDLGNYQIKAVANGSLTAVNDTFYVCVSNSTFTDPSPVEGEGFAVLVRNGTATVGGTGYSTAGTIIHRTFHSGSWTNYVYLPSSSYYAPGGTDVALADGGTGASLTDPNADRIMFWDDSAGAVTWLTASTGLTISGTNMTVRTSSSTQTGIVELATDAETVTGTDTARATTPANITARLAAPGTIGGTTPGAATFTTVTTTGNIELGNASDTTLSRSAAGVAAVEGKRVVTRPENLKVKAITIESPTSSEDISMFYTNEPITITQLSAVLRGSSTPSVTWTVRHSTDRSAAGNEVVTSGTTTTSTTTGSVVTSFNDATIPADSWVWLETSASSGSVDELNVVVEFTID